METTTGTTINLETVVELLRSKHGIANAYVEQTGGGVATIFAGPTRPDADHDQRYAAIAGPGWFSGPNWTEGRANLRDFYIGADDDGESGMPLATDELDKVEMLDERGVAALIAAQAKRTDPTTSLSMDEALAALGV